MDETRYTKIGSLAESAEMASEDVILLTKDVSSLSSMGIVTHSLHLFDTHFKLFMTILLLVFVPTITPWQQIWVFVRDSSNPVSVGKVMNSTAAVAPFEIVNSTALTTPSDTGNSTALATPSDTGNSTALTTPGEIWNATAAAPLNQSSIGAGIGNQDHHPGNFSLNWKNFDPTPGIIKTGLNWKRQIRVDWTTKPTAAAKGLFMFIFNTLFMVSLISVRRSFVAYSVGRIQVGKRATFVDAVRAFRVLWKRVIGTGICFEIMNFARVMFMYSPTFFFKYENGTSHLLYWLTFITMVLSFTFYLWSEFSFQLITYVPILDQACGWKAFGRARNLLKGRKRVSVGIAVCSLLAFGIVLVSVALVIGVFVAVYALSQGKDPDQFMILNSNPNSKPSRESVFYYTAVQSLAFPGAVMFMEMIYAVFCMSCMAFHMESIVRSSFFQNLTKTGRDHDC